MGSVSSASMILKSVHSAGQLPRVAITAATGLSRSAVCRTIRALSEAGILREDAPLDRTLGRPSHLVRPTESIVVIAIRVTARRVSMALVALGGKIVASTDCALEQGHDSAKTVNVVSAVLAGMQLPRIVLGVSVSLPGRVVLQNGLVSAPALGWLDDPLEARLSRSTESAARARRRARATSGT